MLLDQILMAVQNHASTKLNHWLQSKVQKDAKLKLLSSIWLTHPCYSCVSFDHLASSDPLGRRYEKQVLAGEPQDHHRRLRNRRHRARPALLEVLHGPAPASRLSLPAAAASSSCKWNFEIYLLGIVDTYVARQCGIYIPIVYSHINIICII